MKDAKERRMEESKATETKNPECGMVSRFEAEKAIMHLNFSNRRMLIALITVCVTFIITILTFVIGYTVRERNWLDTLTRVTTPGVSDGVQPDADH